MNNSFYIQAEAKLDNLPAYEIISSRYLYLETLYFQNTTEKADSYNHKVNCCGK